MHCPDKFLLFKCLNPFLLAYVHTVSVFLCVVIEYKRSFISISNDRQANFREQVLIIQLLLL